MVTQAAMASFATRNSARRPKLLAQSPDASITLRGAEYPLRSNRNTAKSLAPLTLVHGTRVSMGASARTERERAIGVFLPSMTFDSSMIGLWPNTRPSEIGDRRCGPDSRRRMAAATRESRNVGHHSFKNALKLRVRRCRRFRKRIVPGTRSRDPPVRGTARSVAANAPRPSTRTAIGTRSDVTMARHCRAPITAWTRRRKCSSSTSHAGWRRLSAVRNGARCVRVSTDHRWAGLDRLPDRCPAGNLEDQLSANGALDLLEVVGDDDAGAGDRRWRSFHSRDPGRPRLVPAESGERAIHHRKAVDRDPGRHREVASLVHRRANVVRAVARDIEDAPAPLIGVGIEHRQRKRDGVADGGAMRRRHRSIRELKREIQRALGVGDHGPLGDDPVVFRAGP